VSQPVENLSLTLAGRVVVSCRAVFVVSFFNVPAADWFSMTEQLAQFQYSFSGHGSGSNLQSFSVTACLSVIKAAGRA
jgi:hypothetical protein